MYYDGSNPDFMRPIRDANREEYFLVEFHRTLKNTNMALLRNMIMAGAKDPDFLKIFPNLYYFARMTSNDDLYNATVMYNRPDELVRFLAKDRISADLCLAYAQEYMEPLQLERLHNTRFAKCTSLPTSSQSTCRVILSESLGVRHWTQNESYPSRDISTIVLRRFLRLQRPLFQISTIWSRPSPCHPDASMER